MTSVAPAGRRLEVPAGAGQGEGFRQAVGKGIIDQRDVLLPDAHVARVGSILRPRILLRRQPDHGAVDLVAAQTPALEIGYVPLENQMRIGEHATSWYRGPLVPSRTARDFVYGPYHTSDHAMHYDPDYGVFNHAYAAAWQIGRLLALSDANFAKALYDWRRNYLRDLKKTFIQGEVESRVGAAFGTAARLPAGSSLLAHFRELMATDLFEMRQELPIVVPRGQQRPGGELLTDEDIETIQKSGEDPVLGFKKKITERRKA